MRSITLIITLSEAEHLIDELKGDYIYVGPRFKDDSHHIKCNSTFRLSELMKCTILKDIEIKYILYYCDIYSLYAFKPILDIHQNKSIAIIGDTHHGKEPISKLIQWLSMMRIDKIALKQTAHHKPIFESFGFKVLQLPYYAHNVKMHDVNDDYIERLVFYGSVSNRHIKRVELLDFLASEGLPIDICSGDRDNSFKVYNSYCASINMPLNNDINYRIYEIMASGGVCITKKIVESASASQIAVHDVNTLQFDTLMDCYKLCKRVLNDRNLRRRLANQARNDLGKVKTEGKVYDLIIKFVDTYDYTHINYQSYTSNKLLQTNLRLYEHIQNHNASNDSKSNIIENKELPNEWVKSL